MTSCVAQEHKEILVRSDPEKPWGVQQGHLYMRPYQRHYDDSLQLVWVRPPTRVKVKKPPPPKKTGVDLLIQRRRVAWAPLEKEEEYGRFYG